MQFSLLILRSGQLYKVTSLTPEQPTSVKCMITIFMGAGVVDGEGISVKVGVGVIKGFFQNILKQMVGKSKSCS